MNTSLPVPFTLNGRIYKFHVQTFLNKMISTHVSKNCRTYNYYRFRTSFELKRTNYYDKRFPPMFVEVLTDADRDFSLDLAVRKPSPSRFAFMAEDFEFPTTEPPVRHELYFNNLCMFEHKKELRLNPYGIITEMNYAIRSNNIPKFIPWNEEYGADAFATEIKRCNNKVNAIVGFHDPKRVWCMIVSRDKEYKIIRDAIKIVKSNEAYYDLHDIIEFITGT